MESSGVWPGLGVEDTLYRTHFFDAFLPQPAIEPIGPIVYHLEYTPLMASPKKVSEDTKATRIKYCEGSATSSQVPDPNS